MSADGFAILCPHCQNLNFWENVNPAEYAITKNQLIEIISGNYSTLTKSAEGSKILHCQNDEWACPNSFNAVIYSDENDIYQLSQELQNFSFLRIFRLPKANNLSHRWSNDLEGKYYCILFNSQLTHRYQNIEFSKLINTRLLSRLLYGISKEINMSITAYLATTFKYENNSQVVHWLPVEVYSRNYASYPPNSNILCRKYRELIYIHLIDEFLKQKPNTNNCPINLGYRGTCGGNIAACLDKNWNQCPAFLQMRSNNCNCYQSDLEAINKMINLWKINDKTLYDGYEYNCWADFQECAFPIIIHNHFVGAILTGQIITNKRNRDAIYNKINNEITYNLKNGDNNINLKDYVIEEEITINKNEFLKRRQLLSSNLNQISILANTRYHDIRTTNELLFKKELINQINKIALNENPNEDESVLKALDIVLSRMKNFWAFKAVYFLEFSPNDKDVSLIALNDEHRSLNFGINGKTIYSPIFFEFNQSHPTFYIIDKEKPIPQDNFFLKKVRPIIVQFLTNNLFQTPDGRFHLIIVVPVRDSVFLYLFSSRDFEKICQLPQQVPGSISNLACNLIQDTCAEVIYKLAEVKEFNETKNVTEIVNKTFGHDIDQYNIALTSLLNLYSKKRKKQDIDFMHYSDLMETVLDNYVNEINALVSKVKIVLEPINSEMEHFNLHEDLVNKWKKLCSTRLDDKNLSLEILWESTNDALNDKFFADPHLLNQLFYSLLSNAINFAFRGTKIKVSCRLSNTFNLSIIDFGEKLEENIDIFKMFHRGRDAGRIFGSGVGLNIVQKIINVHGGNKPTATCDKICDFNFPLIENYVKLRSVKDSKIEKKLRDFINTDQYRKYYKKIIAVDNNNDRIYKRPTKYTILEEIEEPTYKVEFSLTIPGKER